MAAEYLVRMGERLRERREALGISRADLARQMSGKVGENQIYRWEKGQHQPNPDTLEELARLLERPVAYFMAPAPQKDATPTLFGGADRDEEILKRLDRLDAVQITQRLDRLEQAIADIDRSVQFLAEAVASAALASERQARRPGQERRSGDDRRRQA